MLMLLILVATYNDFRMKSHADYKLKHNAATLPFLFLASLDNAQMILACSLK